jgi:serine/threonine protein kinase
MSEESSTLHWTLSPSQALRVDQACNAFEMAWRTFTQTKSGNQQPQFEQYLEEVSGTERSMLLRELILIDVIYRTRVRQNPKVEEYQARFPGIVLDISEIFQQAESVGPEKNQEKPRAESHLPHQSGTAKTRLEKEATDRAPASLSPAGPSPHPPILDMPTSEFPIIPGYAILRQLERGGMGVVYLARQDTLNRFVALKMIRATSPAEPEESARFAVEAEAVARLDHPNIVRIHDFGEHNGVPFFSMEFVGGGNLGARLSSGSMAPHEIAILMEALAKAMHHAHQQQIIHRDLKPTNVLLTLEGVPKIADFGLAKCLDRDTQLTVSRTVMGTASYMAPEQARGDTRAIGPAADIHGLGAILYEMIAGRAPFLAETRELTILQVLFNDPAPPSHFRGGVSMELEAICLKCLEKVPENRYANALDLAEDFRRYRLGEPLSIQPISELERTARWARGAGYEILDLVGCTVLGMTFKAKQIRLNRLTFLKTISPRAQNQPANMARFQVEAEAAAKLKHDCILQIYDSGEHAGQPFLSLEYVDGGTLADHCRGEPIIANDACQLIEKLAQACHCAHQQKIVHSDLRPFNVVLTASGVPKITGFGLARLLEKSQDENGRVFKRRTFSNYTAPEQLGGQPDQVGPATDVYALGAMLYEMVTGRPPFLADTVADTHNQIRTLEPIPPSQVQPGVPRSLDAICLKCLKKDPLHRYLSAEALGGDLRRFQEGKQIHTDEFELIPGFEIFEELGRGGLGVVFKARQITQDRYVALKFYRDKKSHYLNGSKAVACLQHPNLVQVYDCGEQEGVMFVAEELMIGPSLDQRIAGIPQPYHEAAVLVESLARTLHFLHLNGIIHRNLKPQVVLFTVLGIPKIGSFDLAKLPQHSEEQAEIPGIIKGTPTYMSPEQALGKVQEVGPASDIHALGVILYELLTGRLPFQGNNAAELLNQVCLKEPISPCDIRANLPQELVSICMRCLRKDPAARYPSADALAEDLHQFLTWTLNRSPQFRLITVWQKTTRWMLRSFFHRTT